jgi:hypothetical protein
MTRILAWHFVGDRLRDGSPIPEDGEVLEVRPPLVMCERGLHASERLIDALLWAPGAMLCRVVCSGEIEHEVDKLVCERRMILWRLEATEVLLEFARWCALEVAHLWAMPEVVREYLTTGDEVLRGLADAEAAAVWAATDAAATHAAARAAAASAEAEAATAARRMRKAATAARAAARIRQNDQLTRMILAARAAE